MNNSIQKERTKRYFIDAAKELISDYGIEKLSVRKVGEKAGYSYATIYNYFKDINTLISHVALDYLEDVYDYLIEYKDDSLDSISQVKIYSREYVNYMDNNKDIFKIVFVEDFGTTPKDLFQDITVPLGITSLLNEAISKIFPDSKDESQFLFQLLASSIHGKLIFLIGNRENITKEDIYNLIDLEIDFILRRK